MVVDCVVDMFHGLPIELDVERQFAEANGEHLIIRSFPSAEKPVLLLGHTDTVHPIGTNEKNPTRSKTTSFMAAAFSI